MSTEINPFSQIGHKIGQLLKQKNEDYGSAFEKTGDILKLLFPNGVSPEQYHDLLAITRVLDKLFRIATDKQAGDENPWKDIAGYAILDMYWENEKNKAENGEQ